MGVKNYKDFFDTEVSVVWWDERENTKLIGYGRLEDVNIEGCVLLTHYWNEEGSVSQSTTIPIESIIEINEVI
jgi:hypothetical protein